jgi:hypothetical protein
MPFVRLLQGLVDLLALPSAAHLVLHWGLRLARLFQLTRFRL